MKPKDYILHFKEYKTKILDLSPNRDEEITANGIGPVVTDKGWYYANPTSSILTKPVLSASITSSEDFMIYFRMISLDNYASQYYILTNNGVNIVYIENKHLYFKNNSGTTVLDFDFSDLADNNRHHFCITRRLNKIYGYFDGIRKTLDDIENADPFFVAGTAVDIGPMTGTYLDDVTVLRNKTYFWQYSFVPPADLYIPKDEERHVIKTLKPELNSERIVEQKFKHNFSLERDVIYTIKRQNGTKGIDHDLERIIEAKASKQKYDIERDVRLTLRHDDPERTPGQDFDIERRLGYKKEILFDLEREVQYTFRHNDPERTPGKDFDIERLISKDFEYTHDLERIIGINIEQEFDIQRDVIQDYYNEFDLVREVIWNIVKIFAIVTDNKIDPDDIIYDNNN